MYPAPFDYHRPGSVSEAADLLKTNPDAKLLAGGHSLLPAMKFRLADASALIDIGGIEELAGVSNDGKASTIGAMTTYSDIAASQDVGVGCPIVTEAVLQIGDLQVRNRGTIGGSLAHADPAADLPTVMVACGATMTAQGAGGSSREIGAEEFFVDIFETALAEGEILTAVRVPNYGKGTGGCYMKHRHPASSYAVVGAAAIVTVDGGKCNKVSVAIGGVTAKATRASAVEKALTGQAADADSIAAAAEKVKEAISDPMGDHYASGAYRTHLAAVLVKRALTTALERARG